MRRSSICISVALSPLPWFLCTTGKKKTSCICLSLLLTAYQLYSQPHHPADYAIKIKTDNGVYRGLLTGIMDSSIEVMDKRTRNKTIFCVSQINLIKVKKPFLTNTTKDLIGGAGAGAFLVVAYYLEQFWKYGRWDASDPTFGNALWTTAAVGAGVGLMYGGIESIFVRKRIPIYKALYIFENKTSRLKKYLYY